MKIILKSNLRMLEKELHGVFGMIVQPNVSVVLLFFCRFPSNNQCSTHGKLTLVILTNQVISFSNQAKEQSEATGWQLYTRFPKSLPNNTK